MFTAVWLSRLSNLYPAVTCSFVAGRAVSFALNAVVATSPFSDATGTTGVVGSVRNASFCVARPYDPFTTSFVCADMFAPAAAVIWLKLLPGALLIVLTMPVGVAQFCHDIEGTLLRKIDA
jgi:hypothetical protein